jgi:tripartite-type tricarboxylate transporter receptor subunit TctC
MLAWLSRFFALFTVACLAVLPEAAAAQQAGAMSKEVPKQITFVVGFAAGGALDTIARILANEISERAGVTVTVVNRPGASSNLAARYVASGPPDGSVMLVSGTSLVINASLFKAPGYALSDFAVVALPVTDATAILVNAESPVRRLGEMIETAKPFTFGAGGSSARIVGEYLFKGVRKLDATFVPFQGGAPALNALLGGHIDVLSGPVSETAGQVSERKIRALAVSGRNRSAAIPDTPTLTELGIPIDTTGDIGLYAPAQTPAAVIALVNQMVTDILREDRIRARVTAIGFEAAPRTIGELSGHLAREGRRWSEMITAIGIEQIP